MAQKKMHREVLASGVGAVVLLFFLSGLTACAMPEKPVDAIVAPENNAKTFTSSETAPAPAPAPESTALSNDQIAEQDADFNRQINEYSSALVTDLMKESDIQPVAGTGSNISQGPAGAGNAPAPDPNGIRAYGEKVATDTMEEFFKGRYNRSRARLPENIDKWRSQIDVSNPGSDLANFPNSAFTLPQGRGYLELSPFTYYGTGVNNSAQFNTEYLLRYGATDSIELRLFGNGVSWSGGSSQVWGFSPIAFDTKIHLWGENQNYFLPAAGLEAYIQTPWLSSNAAFNQGTQPSISFNFDQSLPLDIDFEYNVGATRALVASGSNAWEFVFQWAFQRDFFSKDFAVFIHGYYNAMGLPRSPAVVASYNNVNKPVQNAVGAGFVWTIGNRLQLYGQTSGGTTQFTNSIISMLGFVVAF
jgi:hypothetical protein